MASAVPERKLVLWRLLDGKPGHENQSLGLARALGRRLPLDVHDVSVAPRWRAWLSLLTGRCALGRDLPAPDLIVGAGHATHGWLLACRRAHGGRTVVLMRPSLPAGLFDLCIVPEHDSPAESGNVLATRGVLNPLMAGDDKRSGLGVILLGGPSKHFGWDSHQLLEQLSAIADRDGRDWLVATSRRTPEDSVAAIERLARPSLKVVRHEDTGPGWLADTLQRAEVAWVTEDSVSMLYEALTAGAACGVLRVPGGGGRVSRGLEGLIEEGAVIRLQDWLDGAVLQRPEHPLDEAGRCADWIVARWFDPNGNAGECAV